jgi:hypothetical protein
MTALVAAWAIAALLSASPTAPPSRNAGVVGTWTLCQDPDHSPRDQLTFNADGSGRLVQQDSRASEFLYNVEGRSVLLLVHVRDKGIGMSLAASKDGRKLFFYSQKTGHTSFYVREPAAPEFECTAR